jgi:hypothetical protein
MMNDEEITVTLIERFEKVWNVKSTFFIPAGNGLYGYMASADCCV